VSTTDTARSLPSPLSLAGRRIVVTGAASGIGRATALAVADLGAAAIVLSDRSSLAAVAAEVAAKGAAVETDEGDLTAPGAIARLLGTRRVHGLAHCAGIYHTTPLAEAEDPAARFQRMMDVNVRLPIELGTAFVEHMAEHGGGAIVLIGSTAGRAGGTSLRTPVDYAASKGAVHTAVRWLSRRAVGRGVLVNAVAPGPIETPMTAGAKFAEGMLPSGRMGRPEEIGWPIAFMLTPAAGYMSGAVVDINGGSWIG
jgi:3-oxoacyl-[acyl-carrier protein] reductase